MTSLCTPHTWQDSGPTLYVGGVDFALAALADGSVLVCGGRKTTASGNAHAWRVHDGGVQAVGAMAVMRWGHSATTLADGRVLVAGSGWADASSCGTAEVYDPASRSFAATGALQQRRGWHSATLLNNGQVLVAGGVDDLGQPRNSAELYDPASGRFSLLASPMQQPRDRHSATLLADGRVLLVSGSSAELYDPATKTFSATGGPCSARRAHAAVLLADTRVLIAGGYASGHVPAHREELWSPVDGKMRYLGRDDGTSTLGAGTHDLTRHGCTLTRLADGRVLAVGGSTYADPFQGSPSISGETRLFDPVAETFTTLPTARLQRAWHGAALLPSGQVLVVGGVTVTAPIHPGSVLRYCPSPAPVALHVVLAGTGKGSVHSHPVGIATPAVATAFFPAGRVLRLTAVPAANSFRKPTPAPIVPGRPKSTVQVVSQRFDGWSGDASGTAADCVLTMDRERTVVATFTEVTSSIKPQDPVRRPF